MRFGDMSPVARAAALMFAIMFAIMAVAVFGAISERLDKRARIKAETAEYWRRERLTPEQRLAEDAAKERAAKDAAKAILAAAAESEKKLVLENGKRACLAEWMGALRDPDSARVENYDGVIVGKDEYLGTIFGRAKNGFGGYVRGEWLCRAMRIGTDVRVLSVLQSRS